MHVAEDFHAMYYGQYLQNLQILHSCISYCGILGKKTTGVGLTTHNPKSTTCCCYCQECGCTRSKRIPVVRSTLSARRSDNLGMLVPGVLRDCSNVYSEYSEYSYSYWYQVHRSLFSDSEYLVPSAYSVTEAEVRYAD